MSAVDSSRKRYRKFRQFLRDYGARALLAKRHDLTLEDAGAPTPVVDRTRRRRYLRQYMAWLRPHWRPLAGMFILSLISVGVAAVRPKFVEKIIDTAVAAAKESPAVRAHDLVRINEWGLAIVLTAMLAVAVDAWRSYGLTVLNAHMQFSLRQKLFDNLIRLPLSALSGMKVGGLTSRLSGDIDATADLVQQSVINPAIAFLQAGTALTIVFIWNWKLALAITGIVPPLMAIHLLYVRRIRPVYRSMRDDRALIDGRLAETFAGIRIVRAFRREAQERRTYALGHHSVIRKSVFARLQELLVQSGWGLLFPAVTAVLVWYGGHLVIEGKATVGLLFAFQSYVFMMIQPIMRIVDSITQTQRSLAAMERVFDLMDMPLDKPDAPGAAAAARTVRELRFEAVSFAYQPQKTVIQDFSLVVRGGSVVALVGPSGAGKTTLTDLVARFYDPTAGAILLNGVDLRQLRLGSYRSLLAIVQQETFLFDGTVRENIAYGRRGADDAQVLDAATRANAHEFIATLPQGYETIIGERGVKLSGGQRQRLSIARAILADPQILILDEATSNLDTLSEQLIQASLRELLANRTTFVIAHRLSTVTHADVIVVLDQGRIVEVGRHAELMVREGMYYDMVERQRRFAVDGVAR